MTMDGLLDELIAAGYVPTGVHLLPVGRHPDPQLEVVLVFGGKAPEGFDWALVRPVVESGLKDKSFRADVFVNPVSLFDGGQRGLSHTVNIKSISGGRARYTLRWNDSSWGLEPIAAPTPAAQTINDNQDSSSA